MTIRVVEWMDSRLFLERLKEPSTFSPSPPGRTKYLFCDNAIGHCETSDMKQILAELNTEPKKLSAQTKESTQPLDSFIISKFKSL